MSAHKALHLAQDTGVCVSVSGSDLVLEADQEPSPAVLETIRRHKAGIIALLAADCEPWTAEDWHVFFDERAGIAEYDGGVSRAEAEARSFEWCVNEWLEHHPEPSQPDRCPWCDQPDLGGTSVVPFGTQKHGHTWLHSECWEAWFSDRRERAEEALRALGISP